MEFHDSDSIAAALSKNGMNILGRPVRIEVAEPSAGYRDHYDDSGYGNSGGSRSYGGVHFFPLCE